MQRVGIPGGPARAEEDTTLGTRTNMSDKSLIDEFVTRWEEHRSRGEEVGAEELCRDHPELLETFTRHRFRGPDRSREPAGGEGRRVATRSTTPSA